MCFEIQFESFKHFWGFNGVGDGNFEDEYDEFELVGVFGDDDDGISVWPQKEG